MAEFREPDSADAEQLTLLGVEGVRVTPLELAAAYRWLALELAAHPDSDAAQVVRAGLEDSASFGMAGQASLGGVAVMGKTGTAEGKASSRTHGWFVGLAPAREAESSDRRFLACGPWRGCGARGRRAFWPTHPWSGRDRATANRQWVPRSLLSLLAAVGVVWSGMQPAPQRCCERCRNTTQAPAAARETLRVGMWTLWHDREVVLTPAGPDHKITAAKLLRVRRRSHSLKKATIRAEGDALTLTAAGKTGTATRILLAGPVTLTAHGETVTLHDPVAITARNGALVIVVTLPVESYVERVVASESGPADSAESLKALAIVVRSFALHEAHGHADYDLCDSTHCQLLHWGGNGERAAAAHAATLATAGETLWFHGQRALAYFGKDCGGRTASPDEIWPRAKPVPYLPSQPDRFCTADGGSEWASEITHAELTAALAAHGLAAPGWQNLTVARRGESGRAVDTASSTRPRSLPRSSGSPSASRWDGTGFPAPGLK